MTGQAKGFLLLLKLTEVVLLLRDVSLSTFVSVVSALGGLRNEPKRLRSRQHGRVGSYIYEKKIFLAMKFTTRFFEYH